MDREILFRGKMKDNNEWTFGYLFDDGLIDSERMFIGCIIIEDYKGNADDMFDITGIDFCEVITETICQYTGTKDKNGTKIYDGDIVKENSSGYIGVVKIGRYRNNDFGDDYFGCYIELISKNANEYKRNIMFWVEERSIEIVGNIYENPELLGSDTD